MAMWKNGVRLRIYYLSLTLTRNRPFRLPENRGRMEDIMVKFRLLVLLVLFLILVQPGFADDRAKLVGIWKLTSIVGEFQDTGEKSYDWGKNPTGYQIFIITSQ
jgi:hypothetical protein